VKPFDHLQKHEKLAKGRHVENLMARMGGACSRDSGPLGDCGCLGRHHVGGSSRPRGGRAPQALIRARPTV